MAPAQYPDCSGTRNLHDNLSDLRAQVAANQRGSQLVGELIDSYSLAVVQAYMGYIQVATKSKTRSRQICVASVTPLRPSCLVLQSNAELAVRDMLRDFARRTRQKTGSLEVEAEDFMDDGTPIRLRVKINEKEVSGAGKLALMRITSESESVTKCNVMCHRRGALCLTLLGLELRFGATVMLRVPSPFLPSSTACAAWSDRTSPSIR